MAIYKARFGAAAAAMEARTTVNNAPHDLTLEVPGPRAVWNGVKAAAGSAAASAAVGGAGAGLPLNESKGDFKRAAAAAAEHEPRRLPAMTSAAAGAEQEAAVAGIDVAAAVARQGPVGAIGAYVIRPFACACSRSSCSLGSCLALIASAF
jgi:hypothetical protein